MQHLLEKYPESAVNDDRVLNSPEKRLCRAWYQTKRERESMLGQASKYITINYDNKKYTPVFDPRYESEIAALHFRILELEKREGDLLKRIDLISGQFEMDIRGLHEEKTRYEHQIEKLNLFPAQQDAIRLQYTDIVEQIAKYKKILGDI